MLKIKNFVFQLKNSQEQSFIDFFNLLKKIQRRHYKLLYIQNLLMQFLNKNVNPKTRKFPTDEIKNF